MAPRSLELAGVALSPPKAVSVFDSPISTEFLLGANSLGDSRLVLDFRRGKMEVERVGVGPLRTPPPVASDAGRSGAVLLFGQTWVEVTDGSEIVFGPAMPLSTLVVRPKSTLEATLYTKSDGWGSYKVVPRPNVEASEEVGTIGSIYPQTGVGQALPIPKGALILVGPYRPASQLNFLPGHNMDSHPGEGGATIFTEDAKDSRSREEKLER